MSNHSLITLKLNNIGLRLKTDYKPLVEFTEKYFKYIKSDALTEINIFVTFTMIKEGEFEAIKEDFINDSQYYKLSRMIYANEDTLILTEINYLPGLRIIIKKEQNKISIYTFYELEKSLKSKLGRTLFKEKREFAINIILKYYLILFPYILYNELFLDRYLLHSSAIVYKKRGIIFPGLGGVGKSTFVMALLNEKDAYFISDNLILMDQNGQIFSCYEAIALDNYSISMIGNVFSRLDDLDIQMSHNRRYYYFKNDSISSHKADISAVISFKPQDRLMLYENKKHLSDIFSINSIAKEVREYEYFASICNLAFKFYLPQKKSAALEKSFSKLKTYQLHLKPYEDLSNWCNRFSEIILDN